MMCFPKWFGAGTPLCRVADDGTAHGFVIAFKTAAVDCGVPLVRGLSWPFLRHAAARLRNCAQSILQASAVVGFFADFNVR
jgi:hypothetical protein